MASKWRTAALVNLAMVVEQANEQVLPAVYLFVGRSLTATPVQLGTLTLCRAMVQVGPACSVPQPTTRAWTHTTCNKLAAGARLSDRPHQPRPDPPTLSSPLSGILGDRYDRVLVLSTGAFIWGVMTSAMALTVTLRQAMMFAALNGVGLALLVPCCQSLIADLYPAEQRGRAFGTLQLTASLGGMLGGVFATNLGGHMVAGMDGWRVAFHTIAALSLIVGALALAFAVDPRRLKYVLLSNTTDVAHALLGSDQPSPGSSCSAASSPHRDQAAVVSSSTGSLAGAGCDRRRPGQAHFDQAGLLHHSSSKGRLGSTSSSRQTMWTHKHSSSWQDLPVDDDSGDDVAPRGPCGSGYGGRDASSDSESTALLQRPQPHVTLTVSRQGITAMAGEQLLQSSQRPAQHKHQQHMLHTQQSVQQRSTVPALSRDSLHVRDRDMHSQHHQQQQCQQSQPHGSEGAGSVHGSPDKAAGSSKGGKFKQRGVVADVCWMLRIKTFQAIVLQGIVGCFPWQAMVFFTLWLQLNGFSNATSSLLVATFGAGVALGALVGGSIGDRMARRMPNNGRIFTAQISVFCGIPLTWLILKGLPASPYASTPVAYGFFMFVMGTTCTWAGAGCNSPIFAEIVPDELRSTIYAFDRSFENSVAACAAPVVGLLAERVFGFTGVLNDEALKDETLRRHNAAALGSSLLACMTVPWSLCLLAYSALHWFYPRDRAWAKAWASGSSGGAASYLH